jgi:hypothetical protein
MAYSALRDASSQFPARTRAREVTSVSVATRVFPGGSQFRQTHTTQTMTLSRLFGASAHCVWGTIRSDRIAPMGRAIGPWCYDDAAAHVPSLVPETAAAVRQRTRRLGRRPTPGMQQRARYEFRRLVTRRRRWLAECRSWWAATVPARGHKRPRVRGAGTVTGGVCVSSTTPSQPPSRQRPARR